MNASRMDSIVLQIKINSEFSGTDCSSSRSNTSNSTYSGDSLNAILNSTTGTLSSRVFGINHNVLRIADGFGGVLFTI